MTTPNKGENTLYIVEDEIFFSYEIVLVNLVFNYMYITEIKRFLYFFSINGSRPATTQLVHCVETYFDLIALDTNNYHKLSLVSGYLFY